MGLIDFKEIPEAHISSGYQDTFELFCQEFFKYLGLEIISSPDRGSDAGKDLICEEERIGVIGKTKIRWIISCKHKAHSGKSITVNDELDIVDRIEQHKANGFIGFYSTLVQSSLNEKFKSIEKNKKYEIKIYNKEDIEREILYNEKCEEILNRFFPKSYEVYKIQNSNNTSIKTQISKLNYKKGVIIKSDCFIRSIYKVSEYSTRLLDYILSNIEKEEDLYIENFINVKKYKEIYNYKGGDLYGKLYDIANKELRNTKINLDSKDIQIFEYINGENGFIEYKFSEDFININYKDSNLNYFKLDDVIKFRTFRAKRLYEIFITYKSEKYKVTTEDLQKILDISYNQYSDIKRHVVDVSIKDIKEVIDIDIKYLPIKKGNRFIGFEFLIQ